MKYMGSKRVMLKNGLGHLIESEIGAVDRFVDLFTGSGAVAAFVATRFAVPVIGVDLQAYSSVLAHAVVGRRVPIDPQSVWKNWVERARRVREGYPMAPDQEVTRSSVRRIRKWCSTQVALPLTSAYGGHYFSADQVLWLDALRASLPTTEPARTVALAALIQTASQCAAAPGHTAQPFQPTPTARIFLRERWRQSVLKHTKAALTALAPLHAKRKGEGKTANANVFANELKNTDLVFLDPPYSGVHYSRFYHVLETVARGELEQVEGVGRYPLPSRRPRSRYSLRGESATALEELLKTIASREATAILTFPDHDCSNGLSGDAVREITTRYFHVTEQLVKSTFSTLGGTNGGKNSPHRPARQKADELILLLRPLS